MFFLDRDTQYDDLKQVFAVNQKTVLEEPSQVERLMKSFYLGDGAYTDDKEQGLNHLMIFPTSF